MLLDGRYWRIWRNNDDCQNFGVGSASRCEFRKRVLEKLTTQHEAGAFMVPACYPKRFLWSYARPLYGASRMAKSIIQIFLIAAMLVAGGYSLNTRLSLIRSVNRMAACKKVHRNGKNMSNLRVVMDHYVR